MRKSNFLYLTVLLSALLGFADITAFADSETQTQSNGLDQALWDQPALPTVANFRAIAEVEKIKTPKPSNKLPSTQISSNSSERSQPTHEAIAVESDIKPQVTQPESRVIQPEASPQKPQALPKVTPPEQIIVPPESISTKSDRAKISTKAADLLRPAAGQVIAQAETTEPPATLKDLQPLVEPVSERIKILPAPGFTFGTPSGFGADWGEAFIGASYGSQGRNIKDDGSIAVGVGFGDAVQSVGFETTVAIISLEDSFADSGSVGFKLHKTLPNSRTGFAVGWADAIKWGDARREENTFYGVVTQGFTLPVTENGLPIALSVGVGTGQFRSNGAQRAGENVPNLFASVGARVSPEISLVTSWTGAQLNIGVGVIPVQSVPLAVTLGVGDITGATPSGSRFLLNVGYAFSF